MQPGIATYNKVNGQTMALNRIAGSMLAIAATITLLGGPAAAEPAQHCESNMGSPDTLKELKHGLVEGYLPPARFPIHLNCCQLHPSPAPLPMHWMWKQQKPRFRCGAHRAGSCRHVMPT